MLATTPNGNGSIKNSNRPSQPQMGLNSIEYSTHESAQNDESRYSTSTAFVISNESNENISSPK